MPSPCIDAHLQNVGIYGIYGGRGHLWSTPRPGRARTRCKRGRSDLDRTRPLGSMIAFSQPHHAAPPPRSHPGAARGRWAFGALGPRARGLDLARGDRGAPARDAEPWTAIALARPWGWWSVAWARRVPVVPQYRCVTQAEDQGHEPAAVPAPPALPQALGAPRATASRVHRAHRVGGTGGDTRLPAQGAGALGVAVWEILLTERRPSRAIPARDSSAPAARVSGSMILAPVNARGAIAGTATRARGWWSAWNIAMARPRVPRVRTARGNEKRASSRSVQADQEQKCACSRASERGEVDSGYGGRNGSRSVGRTNRPGDRRPTGGRAAAL